jgi:hypothetical protein
MIIDPFEPAAARAGGGGLWSSASGRKVVESVALVQPYRTLAAVNATGTPMEGINTRVFMAISQDLTDVAVNLRRMAQKRPAQLKVDDQ